MRDRIDRGFGDERVYALQTEEAYGVHAARVGRARAAGLAGYRALRPSQVNGLTGSEILLHMQVQHLIDVMPAFLLACVILAALPGPATALFLHRSIRDGRAAGMAAVVGNEIGILRRGRWPAARACRCC